MCKDIGKSKHLYTLQVEVCIGRNMLEFNMALYNKFEIAVSPWPSNFVPTCDILQQLFLKVVPEPAASASPGNLS